MSTCGSCFRHHVVQIEWDEAELSLAMDQGILTPMRLLRAQAYDEDGMLRCQIGASCGDHA
eukprot:CAMPEP_0204226818 /NCGR_PEP_ID=MMETSP0361-20130328/85214_1 /ASSEMBLY_ACC=CAM_ASM_000343 /TAXON_ID=268821 /ORGANISM="Scrippsiella Hangoei, Strain SHTV-5" /LENGTH=60 /DNA_ID=CAMNT_0051193931 /DNA_START=89 /DNA_END=269 /DNA_ORIENTATION=-